jgi:gamma-glutamylcyclotransferase (GGCT)/AIG2-like uncharacterized protein YtfP
MRMTNRLFVYGTLRQESRDSRLLLIGAKARLVDLARMRGRLVELGEYPGLVPARAADDWVRGEVYALHHPASTLARLDEYEGCAAGTTGASMFRRIIGEAVLDSGRRTRAWVYVYEGTILRKRVILSGDYLDPDG